MLNPSFPDMLIDFIAMHKSHGFLGFPLPCLDVLWLIPLPSKLGCYHLIFILFQFPLLNHRRYSLPLPVCWRLPLGLRLTESSSSIPGNPFCFESTAWGCLWDLENLFFFLPLGKSHSPDLSCSRFQGPTVQWEGEYQFPLSIFAVTVLILLEAIWLLPTD